MYTHLDLTGFIGCVTEHSVDYADKCSLVHEPLFMTSMSHAVQNE